MLDERRDIDDPAQRVPLERLLGEELEQSEVAHDLVPGGRALDLDDHVLAGLECRPMHLPDRPRRKGLRLDGREHVLPGNPELLLHHPDDLRLGERRYAVLQLRQLRDELGRQQVGPGGEDLAELREGRAELLERLAHTPGARGARRRRASVEPEPGDHAGDLSRPPEQPSFDPGLGRRLRHGGVGRVDDHDRAAGAVRHAIGNVAEEELLPAAHAGVADDENVGALLLGRSHDPAGDIGIDAEEGTGARNRHRVRAQRLARAVPGFCEHLEQDELPLVAAREIGRPRDRLPGGRRPVGGDDDLHRANLAYRDGAVPRRRLPDAAPAGRLRRCAGFERSRPGTGRGGRTVGSPSRGEVL
ncbi:MAG TPA: hypothetical protein VJK66_07245 [Gaiellaceae bacterium]|nr:hypothetical protein [Gaiellaceae bacterium]